jgi:DNA-binding response OmpR family regulator
MRSDIYVEGCTIVLVEDDDAVRELVASALHDDGYNVIQCSSRHDMEKVLECSRPDAFVLAMRLPDGNGLDILRRLREETMVPIMLLSGVSDEVDVVLALELGADDYVTKPLRIREFRARLKALRRRCLSTSYSEVDQDTSIEVAGLVINAAARTVHDRHGKSINLSTLEFDVMLVLARRPNRVFSRQEIMDQARGQDWAAYDRSVDGLICRLRSKLFQTCDHGGCIKTVRGVGYMLSTG